MRRGICHVCGRSVHLVETFSRLPETAPRRGSWEESPDAGMEGLSWRRWQRRTYAFPRPPAAGSALGAFLRYAGQRGAEIERFSRSLLEAQLLVQLRSAVSWSLRVIGRSYLVSTET